MVTKKSILITAGPTWVSLDSVRVISNTSSGETGFLLAERLKKLRAKVTLLLGPGNFCGSLIGIKVIRFKYFEQLDKLLRDELKNGNYAAVIHAAAVSDYKLKEIIRGKVGSGRLNWQIKLTPTKKLINSFRRYKPGLFTVGFKFEPATTDKRLIEKGGGLLKKADLDLVVANSNKNRSYRAYILDKANKHGPFLSKTKMADYLTGFLEKNIL